MMYMVISAFVTLNMLIGILCEVATAVQETEKEKLLVHFVKKRLSKVAEDLTEDQITPSDSQTFTRDPGAIGKITKESFIALMSDPRIVLSLEDLNIPKSHMACLADTLFEEEDFDADTHTRTTVDWAQFLSTMICMRPNNSISVANVMELRKFMRLKLQAVELDQKTLKQKVDNLIGTVGGLTRYVDSLRGCSSSSDDNGGVAVEFAVVDQPPHTAVGTSNSYVLGSPDMHDHNSGRPPVLDTE
jgi:hypothetical protein